MDTILRLAHDDIAVIAGVAWPISAESMFFYRPFNNRYPNSQMSLKELRECYMDGRSIRNCCAVPYELVRSIRIDDVLCWPNNVGVLCVRGNLEIELEYHSHVVRVLTDENVGCGFRRKMLRCSQSM